MSGRQGHHEAPVGEAAAARGQAGSRGPARMRVVQTQVAAVGVGEGPDPGG